MDELITVDGLVDLISTIAGKTLTKVHDLSKPQGVRGRDSDNSRLRQVLGWEPSIALSNGLVSTYRWIEASFGASHEVCGPSRMSAVLAGSGGSARWTNLWRNPGASGRIT